jgi:hypothetical protein
MKRSMVMTLELYLNWIVKYYVISRVGNVSVVWKDDEEFQVKMLSSAQV